METFINGCQSFINDKEMDFSTTRGRKRFFIDFLKENNLYLKYKINFNKNKRRTLCREDTFENLINEDYEEVINYAFTWGLTQQNHFFWSKIDKEWKNILHNLNCITVYDRL